MFVGTANSRLLSVPQNAILASAPLPVTVQHHFARGTRDQQLALACNPHLDRNVWFELYGGPSHMKRCSSAVAERLCWRPLDEEQLDFVFITMQERRKGPFVAALHYNRPYWKRLPPDDWADVGTSVAAAILRSNDAPHSLQLAVLPSAAWRVGVLWMLRNPDQFTDEQFIERLCTQDPSTVPYSILSALFLDRPNIRKALVQRNALENRLEHSFNQLLAQSGIPSSYQDQFVSALVHMHQVPESLLGAFILHPSTTKRSIRKLATSHPSSVVRQLVAVWSSMYNDALLQRGWIPETTEDCSLLQGWIDFMASSLPADSYRASLLLNNGYWVLAAMAKNPALTAAQRSQVAELLRTNGARSVFGSFYPAVLSVAQTGSGLLTGSFRWALGNVGNPDGMRARLGRIDPDVPPVNPFHCSLGALSHAEYDYFFTASIGAALVQAFGESLAKWDVAFGILDAMVENSTSLQDLFVVVDQVFCSGA